MALKSSGIPEAMNTDAKTGSRGPELAPTHPRFYDQYRDEWWQHRGRFAALHWLAHSRAQLIPAPVGHGEILVDIGCGAGLLAPHVRGFQHVGIDISRTALAEARMHGVSAVEADARLLPVATGSVSVVVAGEVFEHIETLDGCLDEIARVMKRGATLVFDTINDTFLARFLLVSIGERLPGGPPSRLHDPALFVSPPQLKQKLEQRDIDVEWWGLRPSLAGYARYLLGNHAPVELTATRLTGVLYQGVGIRR